MLMIEPKDGFERYIMEKAQAMRVPVNGTFELTPMCNMNCGMCYIRMSKEEMTARGQMLTKEEWMKIADEAIAAGAQFILLTGGEPLLYPWFADIYTYLREKGIFITVNTNGTLIDKRIVEVFKKNYPRRINISLYGGSNEVYARLCGNPNGYDQVMRGIKLLLEAGIAVKLNFVLTRENVSELDAINRTSEALGVPVSMSSYLFPPLRKEKEKEKENAASRDHTNLQRLAPEDVAQAQIRYLKHCFKEKEALEQYLKAQLQTIEERRKLAAERDDKDLERELDEAFPREECGAGRRSFWIDWRGRMSGCGMLTDEAADLKQCSFDEAWRRCQQAADHSAIADKCRVCAYKKICQVCPAGAFAETGRRDGVPSYNCECCEALERRMKEEVAGIEAKHEGGGRN